MTEEGKKLVFTPYRGDYEKVKQKHRERSEGLRQLEEIDLNEVVVTISGRDVNSSGAVAEFELPDRRGATQDAVEIFRNYYHPVASKLSVGDYWVIEDTEGDRQRKVIAVVTEIEKFTEREKLSVLSSGPEGGYYQTRFMLKYVGCYYPEKGEGTGEEQVTPFRGAVEPGSLVKPAEEKDLRKIFCFPDEKSNIASVGSVRISSYARNDGDGSVDLQVDLNALLQTHCAILASTGAGKSNAVAVLLEEMESRLEKLRKAGVSESNIPTVIVFDEHREYAVRRLDEYGKVRVDSVTGNAILIEPKFSLHSFVYELQHRESFRLLVDLLGMNALDRQHNQGRGLEIANRIMRYVYLTRSLHRLVNSLCMGKPVMKASEYFGGLIYVLEQLAVAKRGSGTLGDALQVIKDLLLWLYSRCGYRAGERSNQLEAARELGNREDVAKVLERLGISLPSGIDDLFLEEDGAERRSNNIVSISLPEHIRREIEDIPDFVEQVLSYSKGDTLFGVVNRLYMKSEVFLSVITDPRDPRNPEETPLSGFIPGRIHIVQMPTGDTGACDLLINYILRAVATARKHWYSERFGSDSGVASDGSVGDEYLGLFRGPVVLVFEEAHKYFAAEKGAETYVKSGGYLNMLIKEARKFGIGMIFVSQRPRSLSGDVISQCGTKVMLKMHDSEDRRYVAQLVPELASMVDILAGFRRGDCVITGEAVVATVLGRFRKSVTKPKGESFVFFSEDESVTGDNSVTGGDRDTDTEGIEFYEL